MLTTSSNSSEVKRYQNIRKRRHDQDYIYDTQVLRATLVHVACKFLGNFSFLLFLFLHFNPRISMPLERRITLDSRLSAGSEKSDFASRSPSAGSLRRHRTFGMSSDIHLKMFAQLVTIVIFLQRERLSNRAALRSFAILNLRAGHREFQYTSGGESVCSMIYPICYPVQSIRYRLVKGEPSCLTSAYHSDTACHIKGGLT